MQTVVKPHWALLKLGIQPATGQVSFCASVVSMRRLRMLAVLGEPCTRPLLALLSLTHPDPREAAMWQGKAQHKDG